MLRSMALVCFIRREYSSGNVDRAGAVSLDHTQMERVMRARVAQSLLISVLTASSAAAQAPATQQSASTAPDVGVVAPDFALAGANAQGAIGAPVKLSEYRGKVVV